MKRVVYILLLLGAMMSCDKEGHDEISFVGDSIIAKWDVGFYFPSYITHNFGQSGCGVSHFRQFAGTFTNKAVVIEVGTNDLAYLDESEITHYCDIYLESILKLDAAKVYLFSVLPRDDEYVDSDINDRIRLFNQIIMHRVSSIPSILYIDVYKDFLIDGHINPSLYECDRLHLSIDGYSILRSRLLESQS